MLQYVLWGISFITLWLIIVWLNFLYSESRPVRVKVWPKVTFAIPAHNEEATIVKTLSSLIDADYPSKEIIVVDDGSTDSTADVVRGFIKTHPDVKLIVKRKGGKASAINAALRTASGELFGVIDADSRILPDAVKKMVPHVLDENVGAVISRIRVDKPGNFLERMQYFEYIMSSMTRFIMNNFGTLAITHGALSLFRVGLLRKLGGFVRDKNNLTEDFEIALRLKYNGYSIVMEPDALSYTVAPGTMSALWRQRMRWSRGYIYNLWNYRSMFFSRKHGIFGVFQLPVNVLAVLLLIGNVGIIAYDLLNRTFDFVFRSLTIPDYFINSILDWPSMSEFILGMNIQVYLPIFLAFVFGIYLILFAHRLFNERLRKHVAPLVAYTLVMPYFSTLNWANSIWKEAIRARRKW